MWLFRVEDWLNALSHTWHLCSFSPLWILLWLTRLPDFANRLLQTVHSNGFSPEWLRTCDAKSSLLWHHLPHSGHVTLPVWIFIWRDRLPRVEKRLSHSVHKYNLSPVCLLAWTFILSLRANRLSHTVHWKGFSPLCIRLWMFKYELCTNRLLHIVHKYPLDLASSATSVILLLSAPVFTKEDSDMLIFAASDASYVACNFLHTQIYMHAFITTTVSSTRSEYEGDKIRQYVLVMSKQIVFYTVLQKKYTIKSSKTSLTIVRLQ